MCGVKQRPPSPTLSQWSTEEHWYLWTRCWPWDVNPPHPGVTGLDRSVNLVLGWDNDVRFYRADGSRLLGSGQTAFTVVLTFLERKECWSVKVLFCLWFLCKSCSSAWPKVKKPLIILPLHAKKIHSSVWKWERGCPSRDDNHIWPIIFDYNPTPIYPKIVTLTFGILHVEDDNMTPVHGQDDGLAPLSSPK